MTTNKDAMFETATRQKLRFSSVRGELSVEQLWDVPLRGREGFDLDTIAKTANAAYKAVVEESFVDTAKPRGAAQAELRLELVKLVISVKLAEEEAAKTRSSRRAEKERLLQILAEKQAGALTSLTEQELQARINALDA